MQMHRILGVTIAGTNPAEAVDCIQQNARSWRGEYVCIANVHTTVMAYDDPAYAAIQNGAVLALPDGGPIASLMRRRGDSAAARVAGPDLMAALLQRGMADSSRHFFYGGSEETLAMLRTALLERFPGLTVAGMISPPFRPLTAEEDAEYTQQIAEARPDYVWVGLGAPKQEQWMAAHKGRIPALMIGTGAAFDFLAGTVKRAPHWMQAHSLEWLYRITQDPRRLIGRYLRTNTRFLWLVAWGKDK